MVAGSQWTRVAILEETGQQKPVGPFDRVRKLFEKRSDIRAKIRQQGVEEGLRQGRQQGVEQGRRQERRRISETLRRFGTRDEASGAVTLTLTPEAMALLLDMDDPDDAGG